MHIITCQNNYWIVLICFVKWGQSISGRVLVPQRYRSQGTRPVWSVFWSSTRVVRDHMGLKLTSWVLDHPVTEASQSTARLNGSEPARFQDPARTDQISDWIRPKNGPLIAVGSKGCMDQNWSVQVHTVRTNKEFESSNRNKSEPGKI